MATLLQLPISLIRMPTLAFGQLAGGKVSSVNEVTNKITI